VSIGLQIKRYALALAAIIVIMLLAAGVGTYVLAHQRVRFPWQHIYDIQADFSNAQAVTPGQGQTVAVAGVTVGLISSVTLHDGVARVHMEIRSDKLKAIHKDAHMLLRPKTGLQDMSVEVDPGSPSAPKLGPHDVLPISQTLPSVNSDELLASLDSDTRAWLQTLLATGAQGLKGNGLALRALLKAGAPTLKATKKVTDAIEARRGDLAHLVHDLGLLTGAAAKKDDELASLITAGNQTFGALAESDAELRSTLQKLPGTLSAARGALTAAEPLSRELKPALAALEPSIRAITPALPKLDPLLADSTPAAKKIRGLVKRARPVLSDARPALSDLDTTTPVLSRAFDTLEYVVNELGYNPPGKEEGYLFWLGWFAHNSNSILSVEDANGGSWRGGLLVSCTTLAIPQVSAILSLMTPLPPCPADKSGDGNG
jgi:phospholipid/cholesterol/gamma-HCH transport system substrate-binding protein